MPLLEIAANAAMAVSVVLAGRNSIHCWWTGMLGCALFTVVFFRAQLYADVTLQLFLIATSIAGWWRWRRRELRPASAMAAGRRGELAAAAGMGIVGAAAYGSFLSARTDAYAPFADSLVLMFSVIAQLLLLRRRVESWWFWIVVNLIAIPLFASRGLWITSALYAAYLVNAALALRHWRRLEQSHGHAG